MENAPKVEGTSSGTSALSAGLCCGSAERVRGLVSIQAEDEGIWFDAVTCAEAYLQERIRDLHAAIEAEFGAT